VLTVPPVATTGVVVLDAALFLKILLTGVVTPENLPNAIDYA
jgi:hypothetical protein